MKLKNSVGWRIGTSTAALLLCVTTTATALMEANASKVHGFLGTSPTRMETEGEGTEYYKSVYSTWEEQFAHAKEIINQIEEEGSVLLKNEGVLPIAEGAKVSLFSRSAVDIVYAGTGSGSIDTSMVPSLKEAMESAGFSVNDTLWDFYASQSGYTRTTSDVAEVPVGDYSQEVLDSYADYADAAIVVFSRAGGEGDELDTAMEYLELQDSEKELLRHVQENFDKIIVLVNSSNAMSLGWLDEYGVDACLWIGGPGQEGLYAVAEMLNGSRTPSGKLADIYAANSFSSPAMQNFGDFAYANAVLEEQQMDTWPVTFTTSDGQKVDVPNAGKYVVEKEGIYVGYKYYETRYEDCVLGQGNANGDAGVYESEGSSWNYADEVAYAFGYGLSYTDFEQTLDSVKVDGEEITAQVTVKNVGDAYSGKDVVEVYVQAPYTAGGVEKSSVQLCGFGKTGVLAPGESETVTITMSARDFASYDYKENKTYILDEGTYYFAIGNGSHEAINNILAAKGKTAEDGMDAEGNPELVYAAEFSFTKFDTDAYSGNEVTNLFEEADLNYYIEDGVTYLSRSDWQNTWPETESDLAATDEMIKALQNNYEAVESGITSITYGADNGMNLAQMKGIPYSDEAWERLLDQMTFDEQIELVVNGASQTAACLSIAFPGTVDADGPAGLGSMTGRRYYYEDPEDENTVTSTSAIGYNSSVVIASTWNTELAYQRGESIGEDGLWTNTQGWWGPGANTHRTPYGGRNFEYYSEDAFLGGKIAASDVSGGQSKGMRAFIKHFAANDQETNRHGLSTFNNEQAFREIYFKQFQYIVQEGGTLSLMESFNRVGCTWAGAYRALCTDLLRNEWGFEGSVLTDFNFLSDTGWMNIRSGLAGGTDQWLALGATELAKMAKEDINLAAEVREASHRILYAVAQTSAINGMNETTKVIYVKAWWEILLYALDIVFGILAAAGFALIVADDIKKRGHKAAVK